MKDLRKFGILFSIIFGLLAYYSYLKKVDLAIFLILVSIFFIFSAAFRPTLLKWFFDKWMYFALFLSRIMTPLIFFFLYVLLIIPIGLFLIVFNKINSIGSIQESFWDLRHKSLNDSNMEDQF
jgi:hypothetical protein